MSGYQDGGCLCGAVRYRAAGEPQDTSLCHCDSCRRATGGPSLAWVIFNETQVTLTKGALTLFESSPGVERGFCAKCGTSLSYRRANRPGLFDVTTATLDNPSVFPPSKEIWVEEKLAWEVLNSELPQFARFSTPMSANGGLS
jgi:hypothetical protein